ncbi:MAG: SufD family Fe-S cluster assembly protein [candidate division WOR-3 bacterium]
MVKLDEIRAEAKRLYEQLPLPESKYTNLKWWKDEDYLIEGELNVDISGPEGVKWEFLESANIGGLVPINANKFMALHYANIDRVLRVEFPENFRAETPVYIKVNVKGRGHLHVLVEGKRNGKGEIVIFSSGKGLYTEVIETYVDQEADIKIGALESLDKDSVVFSSRAVKTLKFSKSQLVGAWFGGKFVMSKHLIKPLGEESQIEDVQVLLGEDSQHFDISTHLDFSAPYTKGESMIRAVLKDTARAVMYGLIDIEREAQFADAYLSEHALLLNSGARADSIPGLEIMANQVRATHGATVGPIDPEQMFYLMSRGLDEIEAKKLIVMGFFEPATSRMGIEEVRDVIYNYVEEVLSEKQPV